MARNMGRLLRADKALGLSTSTRDAIHKRERASTDDPGFRIGLDVR
jgi:hypothetical protein